jgi:hypothetical protein
MRRTSSCRRSHAASTNGPSYACVNRHFHDRADDGQIALSAAVASRQCHAREPLFSSDTTGKWQLAINAAPIPPHQNLQIP